MPATRSGGTPVALVVAALVAVAAFAGIAFSALLNSGVTIAPPNSGEQSTLVAKVPSTLPTDAIPTAGAEAALTAVDQETPTAGAGESGTSATPTADTAAATESPDTAVPEAAPTDTVATSAGGTKGRPIFDTPTPPTSEGQQVSLEDTAFAGGYRYLPPSVYEGQTAVWVYGQGTGFSSMSAPFVLTRQPTGSANLLINGMDSEDSAATPMRILINGTEIFRGPDPLPNDAYVGAGSWGSYTWTFDASALQPGDNTLTVENLSPSSALGVPFIMLDSAQLTWDGEQ